MKFIISLKYGPVESFSAFIHNKRMIGDPLLETHGPVDSLTVERALFRKKGFGWKEGPRQFDRRYSWNDDGLLASVEEEGETCLYAYNEKGLETARYFLDEEGSIRSRELREWDASNRLLRVRIRKGDEMPEDLYEYEYDKAGRMVAEKRGNRVRVEKRSREGVVEQEYLYDGDNPDLVTEYLRDDGGRLVTERIKDPDGRTHRCSQFTWDDNGRLESLVVLDSGDRPIRDESYAYGASLGERWLERVTWIPDGGRRGRRRPAEVVYRSFTLGGDRDDENTDGTAGDEALSSATLAFANGLYTGPLEEGKPEGDGLFRYNDQSIYRGEFRAGVMNGRGELTWPDGRKMEGTFSGGLLGGHGTCMWPDGSRYEGEFLNGRMHGVGTFIWADGTRFQGLFEKGKRTDQGAWEKQ